MRHSSSDCNKSLKVAGKPELGLYMSFTMKPAMPMPPSDNNFENAETIVEARECITRIRALISVVKDEFFLLGSLEYDNLYSNLSMFKPYNCY